MHELILISNSAFDTIKSCLTCPQQHVLAMSFMFCWPSSATNQSRQPRKLNRRPSKATVHSQIIQHVNALARAPVHWRKIYCACDKSATNNRYANIIVIQSTVALLVAKLKLRMKCFKKRRKNHWSKKRIYKK